MGRLPGGGGAGSRSAGELRDNVGERWAESGTLGLLPGREQGGCLLTLPVWLAQASLDQWSHLPPCPSPRGKPRDGGLGEAAEVPKVPVRTMALGSRGHPSPTFPHPMEEGKGAVCPTFSLSPLQLSGEWLWEASRRRPWPRRTQISPWGSSCYLSWPPTSVDPWPDARLAVCHVRFCEHGWRGGRHAGS